MGTESVCVAIEAWLDDSIEVDNKANESVEGKLQCVREYVSGRDVA